MSTWTSDGAGGSFGKSTSQSKIKLINFAYNLAIEQGVDNKFATIVASWVADVQIPAPFTEKDVEPIKAYILKKYEKELAEQAQIEEMKQALKSDWDFKAQSEGIKIEFSHTGKSLTFSYQEYEISSLHESPEKAWNKIMAAKKCCENLVAVIDKKGRIFAAGKQVMIFNSSNPEKSIKESINLLKNGAILEELKALELKPKTSGVKAKIVELKGALLV